MKDIILSGFMNGGAGGGSAGVTSWNDLKDRPFGEETEWMSKFSVTTQSSDWSNKVGTVGTCITYSSHNFIDNVYGTGTNIELPKKARLVFENEKLGRVEYEYEYVENISGIQDQYTTNIVGWYGDISKAVWEGEYNPDGDPCCMLIRYSPDYDYLYFALYARNDFNLIKEESGSRRVPTTFEFIAEETISITPIDPKFIPKVAAVSDIITAPTAEQFNALLAALRNAGYMEE